MTTDADRERAEQILLNVGIAGAAMVRTGRESRGDVNPQMAKLLVQGIVDLLAEQKRECDPRDEELRELRSQLATAVEKLKKYGVHRPACRVYDDWEGSQIMITAKAADGEDCTCGLDAALTALEGNGE